MLKQNTLNDSFTLSGKGLHTGLRLTATFCPAPENHGYKIQRIDLPGQPVIDAVAENVVDTQRGTVLAQADARCSTVEHAMAALYAHGVDNVLIKVDGPELPILDGSAACYVKEIQRVGLKEQDAPKDYFVITKKMEFRDENTGACITLLPDEDFSITSMISFQGKVLSSQFATLDSMDDFDREISAARTFVFVREIEPLL
ncbi:MAG: UDP-3-O-acyl-N-acetylglucosamine deacetylase, partial [Bacteroidaceae bacterium]|nr:UDP-3-O-acyl-N-acetylglucosamine deacetylase [Bacteroidaceae bacterium]